jgi:FMN phosphatase YigB (HAD superfamily)
VPFLGPPIDKVPRAMIFDIGRVIIRVDLSRSIGKLGKRDVSADSHLQVLRELQADPRWPDWQEGRMTAREWHAHLAQKYQFSNEFDEFCATWNSVLEPGTILPDALFDRLSESCRLALLSNTDPIHVAHMEATFPFVHHFPVRIYSCRVGVSKPSPAIFHRALRELGALPEEAMFVDDVSDNVSAAARLGIRAFHFISADEFLDQLRPLGITLG